MLTLHASSLLIIAQNVAQKLQMLSGRYCAPSGGTNWLLDRWTELYERHIYFGCVIKKKAIYGVQSTIRHPQCSYQQRYIYSAFSACVT